ncbi:hypothetical protein [Cedecea sp.]|uniref:hypothetical protein n=1 Tax=Cedecea sp. TaxID=1970739 RepID=UPI0012ADAFA1|nr:hypothetical protein [Enterobacteriaceae bacterium RIT693]
MKSKWILGAVALTASVAAILVIQLSFFSTPPFVSGAQERLESYLSYSYGPQHCSSVEDTDEGWKISCDANDGKQSFVYIVHDAKEAPYGFFLTAINDAARATYDVDLLSFLDIRINS